MANKIMEVTKLLGLESFEEFKIEDYPTSKFRFTDSEFQVTSFEAWSNANPMILGLLICGKKITRLPYHPKFDDKYWTYVDSTWFPTTFLWKETPIDYAFLGSGMVFRSYEEAIAGRADVYRKLTDREWKGE